MSGKKVSRNKFRKKCKNLAHNLKVVGSNPTPATTFTELANSSRTAPAMGLFSLGFWAKWTILAR